MRTAYLLSVQFDTKPQAEQARKLLISLNPAAYRFSAVNEAGREVWAEQGKTYGADDVRV